MKLRLKYWLGGAVALSSLTGALASAADHWAFQPARDNPPPKVQNRAWPRTPVDQFVLANLERAKLSPSPAAELRVLLRRITFDLTGLPPTTAETDAFLERARSNPTSAVDEVIERLLSSPHYGERWARWWLDVARYADTNGQDENKVMANAWRYRDWVVRAFNANLPFDRFIKMQLAGDLLPESQLEQDNLDRLIATGFLVLGPKMLAEQDKPKLVMDIVDEQIDTVGRAFLGLTLGCARCHDHKFDPVSASDYYAMAGIFRSTRTMQDLAFVSKFNERSVATRAELAAIESHRARLTEQTNRIDLLVREANALLTAGSTHPTPKNAREKYPKETQEALAALEKARDDLIANTPPEPFALAVVEDQPVDLPVHLRGSHLTLAKEPVKRGFLSAVKVPNEPSIPAEQSGRRQLSEWIAHAENPLTARVIVNRIWQAHFGEGLVRSADNFGVRGETPSHPELLDWLAREFIRSGWDLKAMHRLILRSSTYRQSSRAVLDDPEDRLLARFPRQRLEAEMIRDGVLAASKRLDRRAGGTLVGWKNNDYTPGDNVSAGSVRRTLYLPIVRDRVYEALTIFDFANPSVCTAKRSPTVVSHQALFFLNSPLVKESAEAIAREVAEAPDAPGRIAGVFRAILQRPPTPRELDRCLDFFDKLKSESDLEKTAALCQTLLASNEFVYRQ